MFNIVGHNIEPLNRVTLDDGTRYYETPTGNRYPSVTTVTGFLKKDVILEWRKRVGEVEANRVSSIAAGRGTRIHSLCEDHLKNKPVAVKSMLDIEMWNSIKAILDNNVNNVHCNEVTLYSDALQVAGTVDCIAEYNSILSVIDFKTSKRVKHKDDIGDYFMQCSAYAQAYYERTGLLVKQCVIIMGVDDDFPLVFVEPIRNWIPKFIELRKEYKLRNKI